MCEFWLDLGGLLLGPYLASSHASPQEFLDQFVIELLDFNDRQVESPVIIHREGSPSRPRLSSFR